MSTWSRLSTDKAHAVYRVPLEQAAAGGNEFYGIERDPRDADSPRPLLALLWQSDLPAIVTVQIYTIEAEELSIARFDPLAWPCGYLSLDHEALSGLVSILEACASRLPPPSGGTCPMFRKLADVELERFGLRPEWPSDAGDLHYLQVRDPLAGQKASASETVLILSAGHAGPGSRLYFKIAHFPRQALERPSFDALDDSLARIHLDREGIRELAGLLLSPRNGGAVPRRPA
jgi:hypothetical protein